MRRIEDSPAEGISESMRREKYVKGVPVLRAPNIALVREAEEKGLIRELPIGQQDVIRRRYPEDGKPGSLSVIGDDLNLTREGVRQREARAFMNIQRLKEGRSLLTGGGHLRTDINTDDLARLYTVEKKTLEEIATIKSCNASTIYRRLREAGVPTRPRGGSRKK